MGFMITRKRAILTSHVINSIIKALIS